jgi:hypothetical protein
LAVAAATPQAKGKDTADDPFAFDAMDDSFEAESLKKVGAGTTTRKKVPLRKAPKTTAKLPDGPPTIFPTNKKKAVANDSAEKMSVDYMVNQEDDAPPNASIGLGRTMANGLSPFNHVLEEPDSFKKGKKRRQTPVMMARLDSQEEYVDARATARGTPAGTLARRERGRRQTSIMKNYEEPDTQEEDVVGLQIDWVERGKSILSQTVEMEKVGSKRKRQVPKETGSSKKSRGESVASARLVVSSVSAPS